MGVYSGFKLLEDKIDELVERAEDQLEHELMSLHDQWSLALSQAATLRARTVRGWQAKAHMLLSAMTVILGKKYEQAGPHELLAASLARDLTAPIRK